MIGKTYSNTKINEKQGTSFKKAWETAEMSTELEEEHIWEEQLQR